MDVLYGLVDGRDEKVLGWIERASYRKAVDGTECNRVSVH